MNKPVDSTDRNPRDFFHFGLVFFGIILGAAGLVTTCAPVWVAAFVLQAVGVAYFLLN